LARALLQLEGFEVVGEAGEMVVEDAPAVTPSGRRPHPDHARQTPPPGRTVDRQCGSGWAVPAGLAGWSEPGNQAKGGDTW
jgi:hypothetical protein